MTRNPDRLRGAGEPVAGDVSRPGQPARALAGVDAAYYLVHSLDDDDFERKDAEAARNFAAAAAAAGLERIIYLGGLGREDHDLSAHLRSRREVERLLADGPVPVTVLRAAIVIGHGGISWEITRQLVAHLPAMVVPRWATTKTQPIALRDIVRYLVGVLEPAEARGRTFEVGGPDVLTYAEMMQRVARLHHHRPLPMLAVPLLTPRLSSHWLSLRHRRGHRHGPQPGRLDEQRGRGHRPLDRRGRAGPRRWATTRPFARRSGSARRRSASRYQLRDWRSVTGRPDAGAAGRPGARGGPAGADRQGRARPPAVRRGVPAAADRRRASPSSSARPCSACPSPPSRATRCSIR